MASQLLSDSLFSEDQLQQNLNLYFPNLEYDEPSHSIVVNKEIRDEFNERTESVVRMYIGEGSVFAIVIISGVLYVFFALRKQLAIEKQQSNFLSAVSHELKTPLTSLRMGFDTISASKLSDDQKQEISAFIGEDINRLDKLIQRLLYAREYGSKSSVNADNPSNASSIIEYEINRLQKEIADKRGIIIISTIEPDVFATISTDQLELVISNLVENSIKFSKSNSSIDVKLIAENSNLELTVSDSGSGFLKREQKKIFKRFYRIGEENTRITSGAGLGLYLVKELIQQHKGKISAYSSGLEKGATFTVTLPIVKEKRVG